MESAMFGHKPGAGAARGAAPAPSATQNAARRWRALIGVAIVVGLLAGGCAGPTPAPPPSPTPGTAPTFVVEPSPTPTPAIVVEPSPTPLPAPRYERADGAIVARDAAGNPVSAVAEDVREKIDREAGLIAGSGRASGLGLSCHVSASGGVMWAVTDGDEDLPAGSLLELVEREGETEIRYHTLVGATHDLNQFRDADDEAFNEKDVPESLKVIPNKLELVESNTGEFEVQVIQTTADSDGTEQDEIIGYVDEQGDWARKQIFEIGKDGKTLWIWDKGQPATNDTPRISPAMVLDQEGSELLQAHGGVRDIRELDNGLYEFTMNDGSVIGAQEKDDKLTLIAKEVEKQEFYHFEPVEGTDQDIKDIKYSITSRIAGGEYSVQTEDLLPRSLKLPNGARVLLSKEIYANLLSQIPEEKLSIMTPLELNEEIAKLAGQSEWAETLSHFTDLTKKGGELKDKDFLIIGSKAGFFILPNGFIVDFDTFKQGKFGRTPFVILRRGLGIT